MSIWQRFLKIESWVEISSQPSSSSLSSAATDEIVTTGLHVRAGPGSRRRRRLYASGPSRLATHTRSPSASSSQEEYEESESEEDHVMTSSNEHLLPTASHQPVIDPTATCLPDSDEDDGDENSTALGVATDAQVFTPQPNAFSHPPVSQTHRASVPNSYFPSPATTRTQTQRPSHHSRRSTSHTPYSMISPSYQADHDAALRASLSTLLSCAAAARGLPKHTRASRAGSTAGPCGLQGGTLQIVPESVVMGDAQASPDPLKDSPRLGSRRASFDSLQSASTGDKGKRKAPTTSPTRAGGIHARASKKTKRGTVGASAEDAISPTLLTWVVSAGVVVIVSALSFSAGYAMGRDVARAEMSGGMLSTEGVEGGAGACGKEAVRGLRRFRWGTASGVSVRV
ncbi:MAG: hypothetical protein M1817_000712 [Caeruleum heppii]|nr:MAG: hypothetical protein M1817_000712 [Caeruleum heppii]